MANGICMIDIIGVVIKLMIKSMLASQICLSMSKILQKAKTCQVFSQLSLKNTQISTTCTIIILMELMLKLNFHYLLISLHI